MRLIEHKRKSIFGLTLLLFATLFIACNDDDNIEQQVDGKGQLTVQMTDAPFPIGLVSQTIVTIDKIEIRSKTEVEGTNSEEADSEFIVLSEEEHVINLLDLANGVTEELASVELEAGSYDQIRLHIMDAKVTLVNGTEFDLNIPSGSTSGLKVNISPEITIEEGQSAIVILDFDVSKSFVVQGNMDTPAGINGFHFKPVVRAVYNGLAGEIEGNVENTSEAVLPNTEIRVWSLTETMQVDTVVTSAFSNDEGYYKIIGLPEGTYVVSGELENYETFTAEDVVIEAGLTTTVDIELTPVEIETEGETTSGE